MAEVGNEGNPQSNPKYPPLELSSPGPNEDQSKYKFMVFIAVHSEWSLPNRAVKEFNGY